MADWDTNFKEDGTNSLDSRRSSESSTLSFINKENILQRLDSEQSTADSQRELILQGGRDLGGESRTEYCNVIIPRTNGHTDAMDFPEIPPRPKPTSQFIGANGNEGTAKSRVAKSPFAPSTIESIPEEAVSIPKDGNLSTFTADQMANFFRSLKIDDRLISHLHRKKVDGKRFGRLKDSELENIGLNNNPVIQFFREKSCTKTNKKGQWVL